MSRPIVLGVDDAEPVANGIKVEANIQLVDLPVVQKDVASQGDQHGTIEEPITRSLDQPSSDVDLVVPGGILKTLNVIPWNRLRQVTGGWIAPAEVEAFWQDYETTTLGCGLLNGVNRPSKICLRMPWLDKD